MLAKAIKNRAMCLWDVQKAYCDANLTKLKVGK